MSLTIKFIRSFFIRNLLKNFVGFTPVPYNSLLEIVVVSFDGQIFFYRSETTFIDILMTLFKSQIFEDHILKLNTICKLFLFARPLVMQK